ncbi:MAG: hypothetical protein KGL11_04690 [Alphaproteobacteria bacterium]|nr:hypothetical protein [Alphaproteobacteria bacterium]
MVALALLAAGCTTERQTEPKRTATEEMLISAAADRAVSQVDTTAFRGKKVFVDASDYKGLGPEYTVAAMHEALLKGGAMLVGDRKSADAVVEMRNGAQSIDKREFLIGIPAFSLPIPLTANALQIPEIALYAKAQDIGVSKLAVAAYNPVSGAYESSTGPVYGFSHDIRYTVLIFVSWRHNDFRPNEDNKSDNGK